MEWYLLIFLIIIFLIIGWISTTGVKSQWIRLLDVFVYGPLLICISTQIDDIWTKIILVFIGLTTIAYNARNWWVQNNKLDRDPSLTHPSSW